MYFERWDLLAPPHGKVSIPKNMLAQLFQRGYYTSPIASVQLAACWRAGVQETTEGTNLARGYLATACNIVCQKTSLKYLFIWPGKLRFL